MSDLRDLYQEMILDHNKHPHNCREMQTPTHHADGYNPLCGDKIKVFLKVEGGIIRDVSFQGTGCAISMASASLMTDHLIGKSRQEAEKLFHDFQQMLTGKAVDDKSLGKLKVFEGVCEFPIRIKCATLVWHTVRSALQPAPVSKPVSTE